MAGRGRAFLFYKPGKIGYNKFFKGVCGMRKRFWAAIAAFLLLSGCARTAQEDETFHILATTYPMYLLATDLTARTQGVEVELLVNSQTS